MKRRILCVLLCLCMCVGMFSMAGCGKKKQEKAAAKPDAFVVMIDQPDGLFNPFYSTSAADGTVVSMTQISMLGASYNNEKKEVEVAYGEDEAVVTKDYMKTVAEDGKKITYTFVLKNGIKFSDGHPLTMEDVLFNYYVYLDPVYTGSNTLYSTDIDGLSEYRTQQSTNDDSGDDKITQQATQMANNRRNELINLFNSQLKTSSSKEVGYDAMVAAINKAALSKGYKEAVSTTPNSVTSAQLLEDYEYALKLFKEELGSDYLAAQDSFTEEPYKSHSEFEDEIFCFMYFEGYVEVKYVEGADGKIDRTQIDTLTPKYPTTLTTKEAAIEYIYNDKIARELDFILQYWSTGGKVLDEYVAKAKEVILTANVSAGGLRYPNIRGIVSLAHAGRGGEVITIGENSYTVATGHNEDGTVTNENEYDILQITIKDVDPKAIWNFAITVAPQHYYGEGAKTGVDIENNQFGVDYASFDFMREVIQSLRNVKLPMGAGPYKVTDRENSDSPDRNAFFADNVVYFKRNDNFHTVGEDLENAKIEKLRYQVVSSNDAIANLQSNKVHYISPAMTKENKEKLADMDNAVALSDWQLGYGYIGINASKVKDINLRKAIMYAMDTASALDYYGEGDADQIFWSMSRVSWAYPKEEDGSYSTSNGKGYPSRNFNENTAIERIQECMNAAGVSAGSSALKLKFTIAGASLQDHPTYTVFRDAAALLNSLGWQVEVVCDTQALTKISTGSLAVWAAAWGSALDPDMYQVYHKNSAATSTKAWGYDHLKNSGTSEELAILNELSEYIDDARSTDDQEERTRLYKLAMGKVLDLAVELPVYQRKVMYAYNSDIIKSSSMPSADELNPYSSPLDRIWEVEFVD